MNSSNPLPKGLANRQAFLVLLLENTLVIKRENLQKVVDDEWAENHIRK